MTVAYYIIYCIAGNFRDKNFEVFVDFDLSLKIKTSNNKIIDNRF